MTESVRYITRLRLENFQSHKDTDIHFSSGINLVTGSSDAGKSAILRALHFVLHNQPRSKSFIRLGADECRVTVYFSDGAVVQRIKGVGGKGKSETNAYIVINPGEKTPVRYERFGFEIPHEVLKALGNPPIDERHGPVSYAEQLAPYFLVSLTSGELPRALSELTGIQDYEEAAQHLGKEAGAADKEMKGAEQRVSSYEERLSAYAGLQDEATSLSGFESERNALLGTAVRLDVGKRLVSDWDGLQEEGVRTVAALKTAKAVLAYRDALIPIQQRDNRLLEGWLLIQSDTDLASEENQSLDGLRRNAIYSTVSLNRARGLCAGIGAKQTLLTEFNAIQAEGLSARAAVGDGKLQIDRLVGEREAAVESMRAAGHWCESCNRPLSISEKENHSHA